MNNPLDNYQADVEQQDAEMQRGLELEDIYTCEICENKTKKLFKIYPNEEVVCEDCFTDAVGRAEANYDSMREEGLVWLNIHF